MFGKSLCLLVALFCAASAAPESRVLGGRPTTIDRHPFMAAILYKYPGSNSFVQRCVGSIVSSFHVLTTAYCFEGAILENMLIRAGSTNSMQGGVLVGIRNVVKNPNYVETPRAGDIAVVFIDRTLFITNNINIIRLPAPGPHVSHRMPVYTLGWGLESEQGPQLETLQFVPIFTDSLENCQNSYQHENITINEYMICTRGTGTGICAGDSGAPLIYSTVLLGIASTYKDCGNAQYPDVFTSVGMYTEWILEVTRAAGSMESLPRIADVY